ncbi:MAG: hypothetical protein IKE01_06190 [Clostridia bacterium]|nr:hypothetical protein [Clostridia bacterium]
MALRNRKGQANAPEVIVCDQNGNPMNGRERKRVSEIAESLLFALFRAGSFAKRRIHQWWEDLANPAKLRKTEEQLQREALMQARSEIFLSIIGGIAIVLFIKKLPILIAIMGILELLCVLVHAAVVRDAIARGENLNNAEKEISKATANLMRAFVISVVLATVFAVWIHKNPDMVADIPMLSKFADWQIGIVNELFEKISSIITKAKS